MARVKVMVKGRVRGRGTVMVTVTVTVTVRVMGTLTNKDKFMTSTLRETLTGSLEFAF